VTARSSLFSTLSSGKSTGKNTKLKKVAPVAEIASSVAIVATLIYLSVQTQQTNDALIPNSRQATLMADMTLISTLVSAPDVATYAQRPVDELTPAEDGRVANAFAGLLRTREFAWSQYQTGILDSPTLNSYMETLIRLIRQYQGFRYYWQFFSQSTNPEFTEYVNSKLDEPQ
jgi:hypothetical protein